MTLYVSFFFHHRAIYTLNTPGGSKELLPLRRGIRRVSKWSGCLKKARNFKMTQEVKFYKCLKFIALRSLITVSLSQFQRQFNEFSWLRPWHMTALMLMYSSHTETIPAQNTSQSVSTILLIRRNLNLPVTIELPRSSSFGNFKGLTRFWRSLSSIEKTKAASARMVV